MYSSARFGSRSISNSDSSISNCCRINLCVYRTSYSHEGHGDVEVMRAEYALSYLQRAYRVRLRLFQPSLVPVALRDQVYRGGHLATESRHAA